jgi:23S rRNA pseudouridine955/2504/2580 synthase
MSDSKPAAAPKVQYVQIDEDRAGQRIDNFLLSFLKGVPKSRIYRILRKGEVRVNKGRIKESRPVTVYRQVMTFVFLP